MDPIDVVEKTSRWSDDEREASPSQSIPMPELPPWATSFPPFSVFEANGWDCIVRHVGYEGGRWLMLVEPVRAQYVVPRALSRAAYRAQVAAVGKKKARALRKAAQKAQQEAANACSDDT